MTEGCIKKSTQITPTFLIPKMLEKALPSVYSKEDVLESMSNRSEKGLPLKTQPCTAFCVTSFYVFSYPLTFFMLHHCQEMLLHSRSWSNLRRMQPEDVQTLQSNLPKCCSTQNGGSGVQGHIFQVIC